MSREKRLVWQLKKLTQQILRTRTCKSLPSSKCKTSSIVSDWMKAVKKKKDKKAINGIALNRRGFVLYQVMLKLCAKTHYWCIFIHLHQSTAPPDLWGMAITTPYPNFNLRLHLQDGWGGTKDGRGQREHTSPERKSSTALSRFTESLLQSNTGSAVSGC